MHTYIGNKKNYQWIWIAVDRLGKRFISFVTGKRDAKTGKELWDKLKNKSSDMVATDYWKAYEIFVDKDIHKQSKAETYTVEGYTNPY